MRILLCFIFIFIKLLIINVVHAKDFEAASLTADMVLIPAGKFKMGCNQFGSMHGSPEHIVYLNSFMIDIYEMTNQRYEKIVPEHKLRRSILSKCDKCPVSRVSWYDAADYCYLTGKSLPTEAQWERAAGYNDGCAFPWGYGFDKNSNQVRGGLKLRDNTKPVGSYLPNKNGIYDMAGNVWEWVSDWFSTSYHFPESIINPKGPENGMMKVRRGGSYSDSVVALSTGYRDWSHPTSRDFSDIGFRCVINIKPG